MECCAPGTISNDDFLRYALDPDDLSAEARQHFAACAACRARAAEYRTFSSTLARQLYRWDCPTTLQISEYAAGLLTGKERRKLENHLKRCSRCSEEAAVSKEFLGAPQPASPQRPRPMARLLRPQHLLEARAAVRGENPWPRTAEIDGMRLSLELVTLAPPGVALTGLLVPLDDSRGSLEGMQVALFAGAATEQPPLSVTSVDQFGNFIFEHLSPGSYKLSLALSERIHFIEGIDIDT